ncbi:DUF6175 family protein [Runella sp.]|uniref:DUF6175 family protein n=1 Tax=Runella sp. TaxID=1960881 RepID=UPI003D0C70EB
MNLPVVIVIPSDIWMESNNYGIDNAKGMFEPDYTRAFQNDPDLLLAMSKINIILGEWRFAYS